MRETDTQHMHIVIAGTKSSTPEIMEYVETAQKLVPLSRVHVTVDQPNNELAAAVGEENLIVEPTERGNAPAVAFAGCNLYRTDPTANMLLVDASAKPSTKELERNFEDLVEHANEAGAMVSLHDANGSTGIYAWSIYALMESYRNYCPVDFPIINEIARTWGRDAERTRELYAKLADDAIEERVLSKVRPGYPTRNVVLKSASDQQTTAAPIQGGAVSDAAIIATPEDAR